MGAKSRIIPSSVVPAMGDADSERPASGLGASSPLCERRGLVPKTARASALDTDMAKIHAPLPFYPWYVTRYRAHRKAQRMTYVERGLYRELLDECWEEGVIPDDVNKLAEIARCPLGVMAEAWPNIRPCFEPTDGLDGMLLQSPRLEQIRTEQDAFRLKQAERARGSRGKPRQATASHYSKEEKRKEEKGDGIVTQSPELPTADRPARTADEWRKLLEKP